MLGKLLDKQRIIISGSKGKEEVFDIVNKVLEGLNKPFTSFRSGDEKEELINEAPIAIILCKENDLLNYDAHIALITTILDNDNKDVDATVRHYEKMVDALPKAGTIIFNEDDNILLIIGEKERPDIQSIKFSAPAVKHKGDEIIIELDKMEAILKNCSDLEAFYIKASYTLLKRLGVSEKDFINIIEK